MSNNPNESILGISTIITLLVMIVFTLSASVFEKLHFHYLHESGMCMIIGLVFSCLNYFYNPFGSDITTMIPFNEEIFFNLILPPIIFSAGYNLKRKGFYKYFLYIISFGLLGTIINFLLVTPITYICNKYNFFYVTHIGKKFQYMVDANPDIYNQPIKFEFTEILLFASVISATDTVAALTFINEQSDNKLFNILFGEGVVNDAVCIVLYNVVLKMLASGEPMTFSTPFIMFNNFVGLIIISMLFGAVSAIACSLFFKKLKESNVLLSRVQEISIVIIMGFLVYTLSEKINLSPILALQTNGICMAQYTYYNLSFQSREESSLMTKLFTHVAEGFMFVYLGLTSVTYLAETVSWSFIVWQIVILMFCRYVSIFGLTWIME